MRSYSVLRRHLTRERRRQITGSYGGIQFLASLRPHSSLELDCEDISAIEALIVGYQAMAHLNTQIVQEYAPIEEEAEHTCIKDLNALNKMSGGDRR